MAKFNASSHRRKTDNSTVGSTSNITAIWRRGIALQNAPDRFAPPSLAAPVTETLLTENVELTGGWKMLADQSEWDEERRRAAGEVLSSISQITNSVISVGRLREMRCSYVAAMLMKGKAVATGFPTGATETPSLVPAYLFETPAFIKWGTSHVSGNGLDFISVRVTKMGRFERDLEIHNIGKDNPAPVGRPASSQLFDIIHQLNTDPGFIARSRKSQIELVTRKAIENYPERFAHSKGLHPSTISRYLKQTLGPKNL